MNQSYMSGVPNLLHNKMIKLYNSYMGNLRKVDKTNKYQTF